MLEAAHRYRRQVRLTSTSEIYGKNGAVPLSERAAKVRNVTGWQPTRTLEDILADTVADAAAERAQFTPRPA